MTTAVDQRERLDELALEAGREIALSPPDERPTLVRRFLEKLSCSLRAAAADRRAE